MFEVNTEMLREALIRDLKSVDSKGRRNVPMVASSPGIGKSDVIRSIAKDFKLKVIDLRVSQLEPVDMKGFPGVVNNRMVFHPPGYFPLKDDLVPVGYEGWLLFLN